MMTSDVRPVYAPENAMTTPRTRPAPKPTMPLQRGLCDWCGSRVPKGRTYCHAGCRRAYSNLLARQGKSVMQLLKLWRRPRGAKNTPGEGRLTEIAERVDAILDEDRQRKARLCEN